MASLTHLCPNYFCLIVGVVARHINAAVLLNVYTHGRSVGTGGGHGGHVPHSLIASDAPVYTRCLFADFRKKDSAQRAEYVPRDCEFPFSGSVPVQLMSSKDSIVYEVNCFCGTLNSLTQSRSACIY